MRDMNSRRENNSLDERIGKLLLEREVEDFIAREAATWSRLPISPVEIRKKLWASSMTIWLGCAEGWSD